MPPDTTYINAPRKLPRCNPPLSVSWRWQGLVVFELLKAQREQSVGEKLSLEASLDAFQQRLLVATREPPPAVAEAAAEEVPPEEGAGAEDGGDADAAEGGEGGPEPAPAPPPPPPPPPALSVADVKNVTDFFLGTFFRHYELHQAVADEGIGTGRVPDGAPPHTSVRLDRPPAAGPVLLPLSAALSEADYFAQKQAAERAAEAAEAEAAAAAAAAVAGVSEVEAEGGGDGADESTAAEKAAAEEEAAAAAAEAEAEAAAAAAAAAAVAPEEDAAAEEGSTTDGPPTLEELLATAVAEQMAPVKAHLEVLMASNKAALLGQIAEAEARAN
eukprot:COSAG01_NODE_199_length_22202_cov_23.993668_10_plen_330_part_00